MRQVHGIKVPEVIDELIEWDADDGATNYEVNRLTHKLHTVTLVPREDTPKGRMVTRHEFLHAQFDNPKVRTYLPVEDSAPFWATNGVADAFVHLVYWPVGRDEQADKEAAQVAMDDLRGVSDLIAKARVKGQPIDTGRQYEITLRTLAILKAVGSIQQQLEGSALALSYLTIDQFNKLKEVLGAVLAKDRAKAIELMVAMV